MSRNELQEHIAATYFSLRIGMLLLGSLLPVMLVAGGLLLEPNAGIRTSLSDYYLSPLRDVFVGVLVAIGAFLVLYRGFSSAEDRAFDLAGACAIGAALVPAGAILHAIFAIAFFLCVAYVALFRAGDTLHLIKDGDRRRRYRQVYRILGALMVVLPLAAAFLGWLLLRSWLVLVVELVAVWVFGGYWAVKSREFALTHADQRAAAGELAVVRSGPAATTQAVPEASRLTQAFGEAFGARAVVEVAED